VFRQRHCNVDGCARVHYGLGFCRLHYRRFKIHGDPLHEPDDVARLWARIDTTAGPDACWPRSGGHSKGYSRLHWKGRTRQAHCVVWELERGPIPDGYEVDHLCHNRDLTCTDEDTCPHRACCNPAHLEAVPPAVNKRRAPRQELLRRATHCVNGHPWTLASTVYNGKGERRCRECDRERDRKRYRERPRWKGRPRSCASCGRSFISAQAQTCSQGCFRELARANALKQHAR
jgi:hypothetical protein